MCGIAGILAISDSLPTHANDALAGMLQQMETRGPDAAGVWTLRASGVAFGHRRLSIIDVDSRSDQPMHSADRRYTLVFNGEIYNYRELRLELERKGRRFLTGSDTEVLLQMYAEHGIGMLKRLRGMFAFAIWDDLEHRLFLARDPIGIKPLYYAVANGCLYFASQVKALLRVPGVDTSAQPAGHVGFFVWGSVPEPFTLYKGIHCLPSGTYLSAAPHGSPTLRLYASPVETFGSFEPSDMPLSKSETMSRLHDALEESIRVHEVADVPVAIFLSAGIDSGIIASLASESGNEVETLTLGFDVLKGTSEDETSLAECVAKEYGLPNTQRYVDKSLFLEHRERLLENMDQPTIDGVNVYFVSWLARQRGFKVALSGLGGDELFGGYPSFSQIPRTVGTISTLSLLPGIGSAWRIITAPLMQRLTSPKYASLFEFGGSWGGAYLLRRGLYMPWELTQFLDPDLVRSGWKDLASVEQMNILATSIASRNGLSKKERDFLRVSALELSIYMRSQLLRDADWAGMAHSLEIRVPFVDMELLRQIAPLRASEFSPRKPGIVSALRRPLPPEVINRPKTGFSVPVREWIQESPQRGLRNWARYIYSKFPCAAS